jgi:hypothetical protein
MLNVFAQSDSAASHNSRHKYPGDANDSSPDRPFSGADNGAGGQGPYSFANFGVNSPILGTFGSAMHGAATSLGDQAAEVKTPTATVTTGFKIIPVWDSSVLNSPEKSLVEAAVEAAIGKIEAVITTNQTIKIDFGYGVMPYDRTSAGVGGAESIGNSAAYTWTQVYNAAKTVEGSASASAVQKSVAALLTSDNAKYAAVLNNDMMDVTRSEAMALGLPVAALTTGQNAYDGWVALGSGPFDWAQNNPNQEDAVSAMEHEISEVMGRTDDLGVSNGNAGEYTLLDLFHYGSASGSTVGGAKPGSAAGALDEPFVAGYKPGEVSYFSYNGSTVTWQYDTPSEVNGFGEDVADWSTTTTNRPAATDSFDGSGGNAIDPPLSVPDWEELAALGYTERTTIPLDAFNGNGKSDVLIENTSNVVDVGEIGANGKEIFRQVTTLGSQTSLEENGDFFGDFTSDFLVENTSGVLRIGQVAGTQTVYTNIGTLGAQWAFVGAGDFLGEGHDQFLIQSSAGAIDIGDVTNGAAHYTRVGTLGTSWTFEEDGDFLNHGKSDFLIQNTNGDVQIGEVAAGKTTYTNLGVYAAQWAFVGAGDFLGEGRDQFLIQNSGGGIDIADIKSGVAHFTSVNELGSQWLVLGAGQYSGSNVAGFLVQNAAGAIDLATIANGHATYTSVGALGAQWTFHV